MRVIQEESYRNPTPVDEIGVAVQSVKRLRVIWGIALSVLVTALAISVALTSIHAPKPQTSRFIKNNAAPLPMLKGTQTSERASATTEVDVVNPAQPNNLSASDRSPTEAWDREMKLLERLFRTGKLREGYEYCRELIASPISKPDGYVCRLIGLRALALFSPPGAPWRSEAYALLTGIAMNDQLGCDFRKESLAGVVGLASLDLRLNFTSDPPPASLGAREPLPVSQFEPLALLNTSNHSRFFLEGLVRTSSFRDLAREDPRFRQWLLGSAKFPTPEAPFDWTSESEFRFAAIAATAALNDSNAHQSLRELERLAPNDDVRTQVRLCILALVASGEKQLYADFLSHLETENRPAAVIAFAKAIPRIERTHSASVEIVLTHVVELAVQQAKVQNSWQDYYSRESFAESLQLVRHYYTSNPAAEMQRKRLLGHLDAVLAILPSWPSIPPEVGEIVNLATSDEPMRGVVQGALNRCPDSKERTQYLARLQPARR